MENFFVEGRLQTAQRMRWSLKQKYQVPGLGFASYNLYYCSETVPSSLIFLILGSFSIRWENSLCLVSLLWVLNRIISGDGLARHLNHGKYSIHLGYFCYSTNLVVTWQVVKYSGIFKHCLQFSFKKWVLNGLTNAHN